MGGFTLKEGDVSKGILTAEKFQELLLAKKIELPTITEEEIKDRSKGDGLSAILTIVQTTWFSVQFFLRLGQGLDVTHIEWLTVAIAISNGVLHFFWWRKPLDVRFPIPLALQLDAPTPVQDAELASGEIVICEMPISIKFMGHFKLQHLMTGRTWVCLLAMKPHAFNTPANQKAETMQLLEAIWKVDNRSRMMKGLTKLISFISYPAKVLAKRFEDITAIKQVVTEEATRIPTFYAAEICSKSPIHWLAFILFFLIFGFVHIFAGTFSKFPNLKEQAVWFYSAATIFLVPSLFMFVFFGHRYYGSRMMRIAKFSPLLVGTYILARIILFVLGFAELRGLPPGALDTIHWPNFILIFIGN